jgi:hypothetical protein
MPMNRQDYPADWEEFSSRIRFGRAGGRCECTGICGVNHPVTGVAAFGRCSREHFEPLRRLDGTMYSRVLLTTAHLCQCEPKCARGDHVLALCQACHLKMDAALHAKHAAMSRWRKRYILDSQMELDL